jgi:hypothetical protein
VKVICRNHCGSVCPGNFHDSMNYVVPCCYHCGYMICYVGMEDRSDSVGSVFCISLVLRLEDFSLLVIVFVHHEAYHGG